jgi:hypothetical protein
MRMPKGIGRLLKREKMELLCDEYRCPLDLNAPGIAGFGRHCMSLPGLSYDFPSYLSPLAAAEIRL